MKDSTAEIIKFEGGNGNSISDAIEIVGAKTFYSGIWAEYEFIINYYEPNNVEFIEGKTIIFSDAIIHHLCVVTKDSEIRNFFFNATGFHNHIEKEDCKTIKMYYSIN
ncbi:MAG: hypothetical protein ROY99_12660 [Ignavibacterium sp.]|jgi:hypothetical protein|nr:hypothetical protein [Ignavibacterium sp.]